MIFIYEPHRREGREGLELGEFYDVVVWILGEECCSPGGAHLDGAVVGDQLVFGGI